MADSGDGMGLLLEADLITMSSASPRTRVLQDSALDPSEAGGR
jgi:hypothetical protein